MNINCPFCNSVELNSRILDETNNTITILSNPALVKGHCLVIPKKHVEKINELGKEERAELFEQVVKMQDLLLKKFGGCDVRQNYRPFQKQSDLKVNHLHIHLQPRELEDELYDKCQIHEKNIFRKLTSEELEKLKQELLT